MEGTKKPDPLEIWTHATEVMASLSNWRETGATNQEKLLTDTIKAASFFSVNVHLNINATIILANVAMVA